MLFGLGLVILIIGWIYKAYYRTWLNPGSLFSLLWGGIFFLYACKLFQIYDVSINTIVIFCTGIISFLIGCFPIKLTIRLTNKAVVGNRQNQKFELGSTERKLFLLLSAIATFVLLIRALKVLPFWVGGARAVKQANAEGYVSYSSWLSILYTFLANPIQTLSVFVIAVDYFFGKDAYKKPQILLTLCMLVFGYIGSGSKFSLFVPIYSFSIVYLIYRNKKHRNEKTCYYPNKISPIKRFLIAVLLLVLLVFIIYMMSQKKESNGFVGSLYTYLVGCLPCGDHAIIDMKNSGERYHGFVSLNGAFRVISYLFRLVGINLPYNFKMEEAYNSMILYEKAINITPTIKYNAFISIFAYFYKDGGIFAVIIGSLIFGRASHYIYRKYRDDQDEYSFLLYLFDCYLILFSVVRMQLFLSPANMVLFYMVLIFGKKTGVYKLCAKKKIHLKAI